MLILGSGTILVEYYNTLTLNSSYELSLHKFDFHGYIVGRTNGVFTRISSLNASFITFCKK